jgi:ketosteroid isomerase-like protein
MSTRENVQRLISLVEEGKFLEAIQEFYAEDATMQENNAPPRRGLAALLENERRFLGSIKEIESRVESFAVDGNRAAINWVFEITNMKGQKLSLDEVAYQLWQDGKIIRERFYYDPAQMAAAATAQ